jgi:hypothetical protein
MNDVGIFRLKKSGNDMVVSNLTMATAQTIPTVADFSRRLVLSFNGGFTRSKLLTLFLATAVLLPNVTASPSSTSTFGHHTLARLPSWGVQSSSASTRDRLSRIVVDFPRGGSEREEGIEESEEEEYDEESDDASELPELAEVDDASDGVQIELNVEKYDDPLAASPMINLYATFGVMLLSRRIDLFNPTVVRLARYDFPSLFLVIVAC